MKESLNIFFLMMVIIVFTPGCAWKGIFIDQEVDYLSQDVVYLTNKTPNWPDDDCVESDIVVDKGLTREQAVSLALKNNQELKADLEKLGIAKSDFVGAGLFTNPNVDIFSQIPDNKDDVAQIFANISINLADLWQVSKKQNIARDELEMVSKRILITVLDIITQTKKAYDEALFLQASIDYLERKIQKRSNSDNQNYSIHAELIQKKATLDNAFVVLRQLIGATLCNDPIFLTSSLTDYPKRIPEISDLIGFAVTRHPDLQLADLQICQADHILSLQKSRIIKDFKVGVSYARDFTRSSGVGPYINVDLPIFDRNEANIAGACYKLQYAQKKYIDIKRKVVTDVYIAYNTFYAAMQVIKLINNKRNKLSSEQYHLEKILSCYNALQAKNDLERAIGGSLEKIIL